MCLSLPWKLISSTFCVLLSHHHASGEVWDTNMTNKFLLLPPPPCSSGFVFDNHWVVSYNPYLTMRYKCHINVEICSSITAVKYLYKYVYKGHDRALAVVEPEAGALPAAAPQAATGGADGNNVPAARDEVQNYLDGRYVSASEACHRLFAFNLHNMHPNVYRLAVHLPNEQTSYFPKGTMVREAMMHNNSTTLTGWCDFNRNAKSECAVVATLARNNNDPAPPLPAALTTLYLDSLEIAVWNKSKKAWHLRKRAMGRRGAGRNNHVTLRTVGRMYFVQPSEGKRYYLRVLLTHIAGATCFKDLKTTHWPHTPTTVVHPTFKAACFARGLLQDDVEWDQCLSEVAGVQLPRSLRQLFASLLIFNNVSNHGRLWEKHKGAFTEDFLHQARQVSGQKASTKEVYIVSLPFVGL
jgi:hypothetical protein